MLRSRAVSSADGPPGTRRRATVALALVVSIATGGCVHQTLAADDLERRLGRSLSDRLGVDGVEATCPDDVPVQQGATFVCVMALCTPDGAEIVRRGEMPGRILRREQGEGGFGYDPLFAADGYDLSTAQLDPAEKDSISHRGHALAAIAPDVRDALA